MEGEYGFIRRWGTSCWKVSTVLRRWGTGEHGVTKVGSPLFPGEEFIGQIFMSVM